MDLEELSSMKDEDVEQLCKTVRRPGGQILVAGVAQPNHSIPISIRAERNLKLACYYLQYRARVSRLVTAIGIMLDHVRALRNHKEAEGKREDGEAMEINDKDWPKTMEAIEQWLSTCMGVTEIPLAYIVWDDEIPPAADGDPSTGYNGIWEELIMHAPISTAGAAANDPRIPTRTFKQDNKKVWGKLSQLCREKTCSTYIKAYAKSQDGHAAYMTLKQHYLGPNNVNHMANKAENRIWSLSYTGEKCNWNFEKYTNELTSQFSIIEDLQENHGHVGIDEQSKVCYLMDGIKMDTLNPVRIQILANAELAVDYD